MNYMLSQCARLLLAVGVVLSLAAGPLAGPATGQAKAAVADHVILISVDGLRPEFYLDPTWPAPALQQMAREGAYALGVRGVFPSLTYPSHTTLVTGALPARHGVHYNLPFEPAGQTGRWIWEAETIRTPTLWSAVRAGGGTTGSIAWPVTSGAPIDYNMPEIWSPSGDPPWPEVVRAHSTPAGLIDEFEREATGRVPVDAFLGHNLFRDDYAGAMAAHLIATYQPRLLTVHLVTTDSHQHSEGRDGPGVRRAVAAADRAISRMLEAVDRAGIRDRTAFIVTGDHGFVDIHTLVAPNVWLVDAGLMEPQDDRGEWRATFHTGGGSAFLHLRDPADEASARRAREAIEALPAAVRRLFRVVDRAELDRIGADPAAAFALTGQRGVAFLPAGDGNAIRPGSGGTHGHYPDSEDIYTGFVAWGAGVQVGTRIPVMGMEDIAPVVARLLDLDFTAPDGLAPAGLLMR